MGSTWRLPPRMMPGSPLCGSGRATRSRPERFAGTEGAGHPFWSPDSRHIGFFVPGGSIRKVPVGGGPPQTLSTGSLATPTGATWNRDGVILFSLLAGPIQRISAAGGTAASPVTKRDEAKQQLAHSFPCFLPDGKRFLYYIRSANPEFDGIYVRRLESDDERLLLRASSNVVYVSSGHLLYVRDGRFIAHPFDAARAPLTGDPMPDCRGDRLFRGIGYCGVLRLRYRRTRLPNFRHHSSKSPGLVRSERQTYQRGRRASRISQSAVVTRPQEARGRNGGRHRQS